MPSLHFPGVGKNAVFFREEVISCGYPPYFGGVNFFVVDHHVHCIRSDPALNNLMNY